jgi:hypothetical protein
MRFKKETVRATRRGSVTEQIFAEIDQAFEEALDDAPSVENQQVFTIYENDCVKFCEEVLRETYTEDVKELMRQVDKNVKIIGRSANATGKTHAAARIALWALLCKKGTQVWTAAAPPEDNLRFLLWGEIAKLCVKYPHLFVGFKVSLSSLEIISIADPQVFVKGITIPQEGEDAKKEARFSGKHAPFLLFILDEADAIPGPVYNGIESCMSGGDAHLLMLFNPRKASGPVYNLEVKKSGKVVVLSGLRHPNVISGATVMAGAVTRETVVKRINEWTRDLIQGEEVNQDVFMIPECLIGAIAKRDDGEWYAPLVAGMRKVVDSRFSYMVLGEYPSSSDDQLISRSSIDRAVLRRKQYLTLNGGRVPFEIRPRLGLDVAELGQDFNVCTLRYGGFVGDQILWGGIDVPDTGR